MDNKSLPVATTIPIVDAFQAIPVVQAIPVNSAFASSKTLTPQVYSILMHANSFTVREQVKLAPEYCFGCPPCLRAAKSFYVSAGNDSTGTDLSGQLFRADEVSEKWNRCCCFPKHPYKMEFRQYMPMPGEIKGRASEFSVVMQDMQRNWSTMSVVNRGKALKEKYMAQPPVFTAIRDGQQCCCCNGCFGPCCINKCLGCYACCDLCLDGTSVVAGATNEVEDSDIGKVPGGANVLGYGGVPCLGGHCTPTVHLSDQPFPNENSWGKIEGPTCFAGCSELCCDFHFPVSKFGSKKKAGDLALIKKRRPRGIAAGLRELVSDADVFTIEFKDKSLTPEQKAVILGNQILMDFMFFEGEEQDKCGPTADGSGCYILLCNCYFYGVLCPCKLVCKKGEGGN